MYTEEQLKAAVGVALRNRDAAVNETIVLAIELERVREELEKCQKELAEMRERYEPEGTLPPTS